jgi:hypothetical protein
MSRRARRLALAAAAAAVATGLLPAGASTALVSASALIDECAEPAVAGGVEFRVKKGGKTPEPPILADKLDLLADAGSVRRSAPGSITVPTYVHVIQPSAAIGAVSDKRIDAQIDVLNAAFSGAQGAGAADTPFRFELEGISRTVKPEWYAFSYGTKATRDAKAALRRGGKETLNLYVSGIGGDLLGYAEFPSNGAGKDTLDGVVLLNESLPGGAIAKYNLGDTAVHEVGHWLGLQHTFANGCSTTGDRVSDTATEALPAFDCPVGRDSCGKDPGIDPVENFMDYTTDECMYAFTPGQSLRMDAVWQRYRS